MTMLVMAALWIGCIIIVTSMILSFFRWYYTEGPGK